MRPYSIHCTTCRARLKVRKPEAVGQIFACPRCGSMVLIQPPPIDVGAEEPGSRGGQAPGQPKSATTRGTSGMLSASYDHVNDILDSPTPDIPVPVATGPAELPTEVSDDGPAPVSPVADWAAASSPASRRILLMAGGVMAGALLAVAAYRTMTATRPGNESPHITALTSEMLNRREVGSVPTEEPRATTQEVAATPAATAPTRHEVLKVPAPTLPADADERPPGGHLDSAGQGELAESDSAKVAQDQPAPTTPPTSGMGAPATEWQSTRAPADVTKVPIRPIDVAAQLSQPIAGLEVPELPLREFIQLISRLTTIPITIRPEVFLYSRVSPETTVAAAGSNLSVGEILRQGLAPLDLAAWTVGDQLVIDRAATTVQRAKHDVSDLVNGDVGSIEDLADLISVMVAPSSWSAAGGPGHMALLEGVLVVENTKGVHMETLAFCERLRAARGLPPRSRLWQSTLAGANSAEVIRRQLEKKIHLPSPRPMTFEELVERLARTTGCCLLVNWQALEGEGWSAATKVSLTADGESMHVVLQRVLDPMQLVYRRIGGKAIEITTTAAELETPEVEFYPIDDLVEAGMASPVVIQRIHQTVKGLNLGPVATTGGEIRLDPPGQCIIVRLPQSLQPEVAATLADLRSGH